jgi:hypothetical protein
LWKRDVKVPDDPRLAALAHDPELIGRRPGEHRMLGRASLVATP